MLKTPSAALAFVLAFSVFAQPAAADRARTVMIGVTVVTFVASVIGVGLSWSDFPTYLSCGALTPKCCLEYDGKATCVDMSPQDSSCPAGQQVLCGANLTSPQPTDPAWKYPVGITSAVVMGVTGSILVGVGVRLFVASLRSPTFDSL